MKYIPLNPEFIFVGVIFLLVIFVSTYGSTKTVLPYVQLSSTLPEYPYEGMTNEKDQDILNPEPLNPQVKQNPNLDAPRSEILRGDVWAKPIVPIEPISQLSSSQDCVGKSSYLSNSMGGICLDQPTIKLMRTRGGNSGSGDAIIG